VSRAFAYRRPLLIAVAFIASALADPVVVNAYLIGPPGYQGGNTTYSNCYGQILAGTVPCAPGLPAGTTPYSLGNGVPTQDGVSQAVPWSYGTDGYIPQGLSVGPHRASSTALPAMTHVIAALMLTGVTRWE
jgi:hypothetical protein